jgi:hypothetical protein
MEDLRALGADALEVLDATARVVIRRYFGLDDRQPWTAAEVGRAVDLSPWQVDQVLRASLARLFEPPANWPASAAARSEAKGRSMRDLARRRGRPGSELLTAGGPVMLHALPALDRELVIRYYGLGTVQPSSLRELAAAFHMGGARIQTTVLAAVRSVLGDDVVPLARRLCVVCDAEFTLPSSQVRRTVCGPACDRERRRALGRAARARQQRVPRAG